MNVRELIQNLKSLPEDQQDLPVMVGSGHCEEDVELEVIEKHEDYPRRRDPNKKVFRIYLY